jgi:hypothetical protein
MMKVQEPIVAATVLVSKSQGGQCEFGEFAAHSSWEIQVVGRHRADECLTFDKLRDLRFPSTMRILH